MVTSYSKAISYWIKKKNGDVLGHVAERGCRTATLGCVQDITGRSPEQLNLTLNLALCWAAGSTK